MTTTIEAFLQPVPNEIIVSGRSRVNPGETTLLEGIYTQGPSNSTVEDIYVANIDDHSTTIFSENLSLILTGDQTHLVCAESPFPVGMTGFRITNSLPESAS